MPNELCLDTTALIHFEKAGLLASLEMLCGLAGDAFAPISVVGEWYGHELDPAGHVQGHAWLKTIVADDPNDLLIVSDLGNRYPTPPDKNQGEMDVVAVSHRLDHTALLEDGVGCKQADDYDVPHLSMVSLLAAAVAYGRIEHKVAWRAHRDVEKTREPFHSILIADADGKRGFAAAVATFRALRLKNDPGFAAFIAQGLDGILLAAARAAMNAPTS